MSKRVVKSDVIAWDFGLEKRDGGQHCWQMADQKACTWKSRRRGFKCGSSYCVNHQTINQKTSHGNTQISGTAKRS